jgi:hypothetical protein
MTPRQQQTDLEILRIFFEFFDKDKTGFANRRDMMTIMFGYCGQSFYTVNDILASLKQQAIAQDANLRRPAGVETDGTGNHAKKRNRFKEGASGNAHDVSLNQDSEEQLRDSHGGVGGNDEFLSFGEFVTLMWTIESDKEKKEALFAGASTKFADLASYSKSKSVNRGGGDTLRQGSLDMGSQLESQAASIDIGARKLDESMAATQANINNA